MPLFHDEDQAMLADTATQFMAEEGGINKQLRHWRDRDCKDGVGHGLWKQMAEMGFTDISEPRIFEARRATATALPEIAQ